MTAAPHQAAATPELSLVIPAYNERESLPELHAKLSAALTQLGKSYEVIYVNDGSRDGTAEVLAGLFEQDPHVRVYGFRRNQGKSPALAVGFQQARGRFVVTLDADGQDEPEEIARLLDTLSEGADIVVGWKKQRKDSGFKVFASWIFNGLVSWATGLYLHDINSGLKAMRVEVAREVHLYGELHRFLLPLAHLKGFRCAELPVVHHPRKFGRSKFGMRRYLEGIFDLITILFLSHFQVRPMHLFGTAGAGLFGLGVLVNAWLSVLWFGGYPLGNRPLLFLGMLLCIVGVQLFSTGLIAEMILRMNAQRIDYPLDTRLER